VDLDDLVIVQAVELEAIEIEAGELEADPEEEPAPDVSEDSRPQRGAVELIEEQDDGGLVLMTGEDSVVQPGPAEVEAAPKHDLPDIDELEQLFDEAVAVSPSILATAGEMDAYAATRPKSFSGRPRDPEVKPPESARALSIDAETDAGRPVPKVRTSAGTDEPTAEVAAEMASTHDGEDQRPSRNGSAGGPKRKKARRKKTGRTKRKRT
jgi:hypothetical protein